MHPIQNVMKSIETTGKTLEEATQTAAKELGVEPSTLTVTVLEQTKGLFGRGSVRIRAEVAETAPTPAAIAEPSEPEPVAEAKPKRGGRTKKVAEPEPTPEPVVAEEAADAVVGESEEPAAEVVASEADGEVFLKLMEELLEASGVQAHAKVKSLNGKYVNVEIDGKEAGFLVGKNGEVLNALQYLVNIMATQKHKIPARMTLDANQYRNRREQALTSLAEKIAAEVKARREEAVLNPLPAFERRIIHKCLAGISGIQTYSEGEEPNRYVVIAPVD